MNALDWKGRLTRRPYLGRSAKCWLRNLTKTFSMPPGSRVIEISSLVFTDLAAVVSTLQTVNSTTFLPINLSLHTISVLRISFSTWIRSTGCTATRGKLGTDTYCGWYHAEWGTQACMSLEKEQLLTILHIAAWSQVGVLVRLYLDLFFTDGCTSAWGICLLSQGANASKS